eukprot:Skav209384  [mRNA]  locus=scaffold3334:20003:20164:- [translate_table: standard]
MGPGFDCAGMDRDPGTAGSCVGRCQVRWLTSRMMVCHIFVHPRSSKMGDQPFS